jgi:hypothetical protein
MSRRVGTVLMITGVALAFLGAFFVVVGLLVMVCGGLVLATGMEAALAEDREETSIPVASIDADPRDIAA